MRKFAHLTQVLWTSGERQAARQVLKKALKTFPEDKRLRNLVQQVEPQL